MSDKRKINRFTLLGFLLLLVGLVFVDPINLGLCSHYDYDCDNIVGGVAITVVSFSWTSLVILYIARILDYRLINPWLHFSKYYLPIAAVLIFLSPAIDSRILGFDKEFMTWLFAGIFFVASLGIIIFKRRSLPNPEATTVKLWKDNHNR